MISYQEQVCSSSAACFGGTIGRESRTRGLAIITSRWLWSTSSASCRGTKGGIDAQIVKASFLRRTPILRSVWFVGEGGMNNDVAEPVRFYDGLR